MSWDTPQSIRIECDRLFREVLNDPNEAIIEGLNTSFGHESGTLVEKWTKSKLIKEEQLSERVFFPDEFLTKVFTTIGKDETKIEQFLEKTWWGFKFGKDRLLVTQKQINDFISGEKIERWQQEAGDIIVFYGNDLQADLNSILMVNVKSHNEARASRPPNIISAERLMKFFVSVFERQDFMEILDKTNYWFIGVGYRVQDGIAKAIRADIRDLFKLDLMKIPQINFDAAIQIQWHVRDMVEKSEQDKLLFIQDMMKTLVIQWGIHSDRKGKKYKAAMQTINEKVDSRRD